MSTNKITVERVSNGYILTRNDGRIEVHTIIDGVFHEMLQWAEGRSPCFIGEAFGRVTVDRKYPPMKGSTP